MCRSCVLRILMAKFTTVVVDDLSLRIYVYTRISARLDPYRISYWSNAAFLHVITHTRPEKTWLFVGRSAPHFTLIPQFQFLHIVMSGLI